MPQKMGVLYKNNIVTDTKVNVLVVDDHKMICDSIAALLEKSDFVNKTYVAYSGEVALSAIKSSQIHITLVDARMPGMSGIDLMRYMQKNYPSLKIVAMTSFDETATLKELLSLNPRGILLKRSTDATEIKQCVQHLVEERNYYSTETLVRLREIDPINFRITSFNAREKEIIQLLCIGKSTKEIAIKLKLSVTTIEDYRKELLRKAGTKNTAELIAYTHRNGLI